MRSLEDIGSCDVGKRIIVFEVAVSSEAAGVNYPFRDALVVEMKDFFAEMKIFQSGRTARSYFERVLIVGNRCSLLSRQGPNIIRIHGLVSLTAAASHHFLLAQLRMLVSTVRHLMSHRSPPFVHYR